MSLLRINSLSEQLGLQRGVKSVNNVSKSDIMEAVRAAFFTEAATLKSQGYFFFNLTSHSFSFCEAFDTNIDMALTLTLTCLVKL